LGRISALIMVMAFDSEHIAIFAQYLKTENDSEPLRIIFRAMRKII